MKKRVKASLLERAARLSKGLRHVKGFSEIEKTFFALGMAASPDERWDINLYLLSRLPPAARNAMETEVLQAAETHFKR